MDEEKENKHQDIDVVSGDGSEINISPVYDHIILDKPNKNEKKDKIVIPKEIKEDEKGNDGKKEEQEEQIEKKIKLLFQKK